MTTSISTGYQFSNLWVAIEGEDEISLTTDDGVALSLTTEEVQELVGILTKVLNAQNEIYNSDVTD